MQAKYHMTKEQNIFLAKRNVVDYIWKSANLEGIKVTYPETQAIYHGMGVAGYRIEEVVAVNELARAWQQLFSMIDCPLELAYVKKIHFELGKSTIKDAGSLRSTDVHLEGMEWFPPISDEGKLEMEIQRIMKWEDPLERALELIVYLMRAQPFYDGNKRISMLIGNKIMIENGCGVISVPQKYIPDFYTCLRLYYETGDSTELKGLLYQRIDGMEFPEGAKIPVKRGNHSAAVDGENTRLKKGDKYV